MGQRNIKEGNRRRGQKQVSKQMKGKKKEQRRETGARNRTQARKENGGEKD